MVNNKAIVPKLKDVLNEHTISFLRNTFCSLPGAIDTYDAEQTTAKIELKMRRIINVRTGESVALPALIDVPVLQLTGGAAGVNFPIEAGDPCLVIFADRDIDKWFVSGATEVPNSKRFHSIADGFALVGFRPLSNKVSRPDYLACSLYNDGMQISIKNNKAAIKNPTTDLLTLMIALISAINNSVASATVTIPGGSSAGTYPVINNAPATTDFSTLLYNGDNITP